MGQPAPLTGSPHDTREPIRAGRGGVSLCPEHRGKDEPFPYRYWPIPGQRLVSTAPNKAPIRTEYTASNGDLYVVAGNAVYFVDRTWAWTLIGNVAERTTPASMA